MTGPMVEALRRAAGVAAAAALLAGPALAESPRKVWGGKGSTKLASEDANWAEGSKPVEGDRVVFGSTSGKDAQWDYDVRLSCFTVTHAYAGRVSLGKSRVEVSQNVRVAGGVLDLAEGRLVVGRRIYMDWGGTVELNGGELLLGPKGLLVDNGGILLSTGKRPAKVSSARGEHFPFVVGRGKLDISNPAGTTVEKSKGLVIYSTAKVERAKGVQVKDIEKGAVGVRIYAKKDSAPVILEGWTFDKSVEKKVEVAGAPPEAAAEAVVVIEEAVPEAPAPYQEAGLASAPEFDASITGGSELAPLKDPRVWTGEGETEQASEAANWKGGRVPQAGDSVLFDHRGSKPCQWDLELELNILRMDAAYGGEVRLGTGALVVRGPVEVIGGRLDLQSSDLTVGTRLRIGFGGSVELGGSTVRLGSQGVLLDGGQLESTGQEPAILTAAQPGTFYPVRFARGSVRFANPAGTQISDSLGIKVGPGAAAEEMDNVQVSNLAPKAAALTLIKEETVSLRYSGWSFDETVEVNVEASRLPVGSSLVLAGASGPRMGSSFDNDPQKALGWDPDLVPPTEAEEQPGRLEDMVAGGWEFQPVLEARLLGGQYFFQGAEGALSGDFQVTGSGLLKHAHYPEWKLIPIVSAQYRGTKQVTDLVGGGTLFQDQMDHRLAFRGIYEKGPKWRIKPEVSYKVELLRETRDESWTKGLFDYQRPGVSVEAEYLYKEPFSVRASYDLYMIRFPNYVSLESQAKGTAGLARELAGEKVLDSLNNGVSVSGTAEGPARTLAEGSVGLTFRTFGDQKLTTTTGDLEAATRKDLVATLGGSLKIPRQVRPGLKIVPGLGVGAGWSNSNQNNYDAQRVKFIPDYYDSLSLRVGGSVAALWEVQPKKPLSLNLGLTFVQTRYKERPVQDSAGTYGSDPIRNNQLYFSVGANYPIAPRFSWNVSLQYGRQTSNMEYEKLYRYNYDTFAYLAGVSWEY